eukprot:TRINITY_DN41108_c0_g1_i1.p1 TRINITY_DN41108_c0_g1~~TRINITY_DN41108_c0_g1_i1.p1  ORF type:complete len:727 (-),score=149.76 TRINITY_DN41108_c0_g1_i1:175-2355(-)
MSANPFAALMPDNSGDNASDDPPVSVSRSRSDRGAMQYSTPLDSDFSEPKKQQKKKKKRKRNANLPPIPTGSSNGDGSRPGGRRGGEDGSDSDAGMDMALTVRGAGSTGAGLAGLGILSDDIETTVRVIKQLVDNTDVFDSAEARELRVAFDPLVRYRAKKLGLHKAAKRDRDRKEKLTGDAREKAMDEEYTNRTALRAQRMKRLEDLNKMTDGHEHTVLRVLDGVADEDAGIEASQKLLTSGTAASNAEDKAATSGKGKGKDSDKPVVLNNSIKCYTCKKPFKQLHFFYDQLCPDCAELNYRKRTEMCDLSGQHALVTGGRVKIGFQIVLKLLRCGANVIVTTRFPNDCAKRFANCKDFEQWKQRLQIFGVDFRDINSLEHLCAMLNAKLPCLHILINNACQTVRRPPMYYRHLMDTERKAIEDLPADQQRLLQGHRSHQEQMLLAAPPVPTVVPGAQGGEADTRATTTTTTTPTTTAGNSAMTVAAAGAGNPGAIALNPLAPASVHSEGHRVVTTATAGASEATQMVTAPGDDDNNPALFPTDATDVNGQQIDMRRHNSWRMKLAEVSTTEAAEVLAINTLAPFILNSKLKPLLVAAGADVDKFVVNVSAMEGKFYRFKSDRHPHTNMAKAALNMMTRTSAADYKSDRIYMTSVDTGWINEENPVAKAVEIATTHKFQTPLDEIDAASRVLDPIIGPLHQRQAGEEDVVPDWGIFLKDYVKCEW